MGVDEAEAANQAQVELEAEGLEHLRFLGFPRPLVVQDLSLLVERLDPLRLVHGAAVPCRPFLRDCLMPEELLVEAREMRYTAPGTQSEFVFDQELISL